MNYRDLGGLLALALLAPLAARAGRALADRAPAVPVMCWRHGWIIPPCDKCRVWEDAPYRADLERANRAEAANIRRLEVASGKQSEDR